MIIQKILTKLRSSSCAYSGNILMLTFKKTWITREITSLFWSNLVFIIISYRIFYLKPLFSWVIGIKHRCLEFLLIFFLNWIREFLLQNRLYPSFRWQSLILLERMIVPLLTGIEFSWNMLPIWRLIDVICSSQELLEIFCCRVRSQLFKNLVQL